VPPWRHGINMRTRSEPENRGQKCWDMVTQRLVRTLTD
jgi:hypothetical protein